MNKITRILKAQMKFGYWTGLTMGMYPGQYAYEPIEVDFEKIWSDRKEVNLYFHIPFCKSLCPYCGFFTVAENDKEYMDRYIEKMNQQMSTYASFLNNGDGAVIKSICFGGGTPNHLPIKSYDLIFDTLHKLPLKFNKNLEPSMEISPELVNEEYIKGLKKVGIRRLSLGVQSLNLDLRRKINRESNYDLLELVDIIRRHDMNINIDIMSGIKGQTPAMFMDTLRKLMVFKPETISIYPMAGEDSSMIKRDENTMSNKEKYMLFREFYDYLLSMGYYCESSVKFVMKNQPSTHQQKIYEYEGIDTMGIGCAARSYNYYMHYSMESGFNHKNRRYLLDEYIKNDFEDMRYFGLTMNDTERKCRYAIYGFFIGNVDLIKYKELFKTDFKEDFKEQLDALIELGLVVKDGNYLILTKEGRVYTDIICAQFWSDATQKKHKMIMR